MFYNHNVIIKSFDFILNNYQAKQNCIVTKQRVYHEKVIAVYENIY